jgi:hypothetical protein
MSQETAVTVSSAEEVRIAVDALVGTLRERARGTECSGECTRTPSAT